MPRYAGGNVVKHNWKQCRPKKSGMTQDEWESYTEFFDEVGNLLPRNERALQAFLERMYRLHCKGDDIQKCPVCGNKLSKVQQWCSSCEKEMFADRHIRAQRVGRFGIGESIVMCAECGKRPVYTRGLCKNCFNSWQYYNRVGKTEIANAFHIQPVTQKGNKVCMICGKNPAISKGMCNACYRRQYRIKEREDRKFAKVEVEPVNWKK